MPETIKYAKRWITLGIPAKDLIDTDKRRSGKLSWSTLPKTFVCAVIASTGSLYHKHVA